MAKLVGTNPDQVPSNADLGTMAYQDKDNVNIDGGSIDLKDNDKIQLGDGADLQIYHDGSNSYFSDVGTGDLIIKGDMVRLQDSAGGNLLVADVNDAVKLFYGYQQKLATTTSGIDVTGELIADSYNETYAALSGTSPAVNCHNGNVFSLSTSGNTTFTFTNPPASGTAYGFTLKVTAGGTHTLTWPGTVDWAGGSAPDAPASGETNVLVFITYTGGTTWYGFQAGAALA